jgi:RNA 3'-terminal phosphate cyclase (ATP)
VAGEVADEARAYLSARAPVGEHLADQLLLPLALGDGGVFVTTRVTPHLRSNVAVIERFTARRVSVDPVPEGFAITIR